MELRGVSKRNDKVTDELKQDTLKYAAELDSQKTYLDVQSKQWALEVDNAHYQLDRAIADLGGAVAGFKAVKELQAKGTEGIMNVGAQLAASAMNAINANASMGATQSGSETETWGHSDTMVESHPYEDQASPS